MGDKHLVAAFETLGAQIADLKLSLWLKGQENEDLKREVEALKKELAEAKEGKVSG